MPTPDPRAAKACFGKASDRSNRLRLLFLPSAQLDAERTLIHWRPWSYEPYERYCKIGNQRYIGAGEFSRSKLITDLIGPFTVIHAASKAAL